MFSPADGLDDFRRKRSGIRDCCLETARDIENAGACADGLHTFHDIQQKRTAVHDCCRLEAARDLESVGACEDGLHTSRKRTVIRDLETLCDLENVVLPSSITPMVSAFSPVSGLGEISSRKCTPAFSDVAGAPSSLNVSTTRSSPTFEEHHAESTSHLSHEESGADADEVTSSLYATGRLQDLKVDGVSTLAKSRSECSLVTSTHVAVVNKGTGEDRNTYHCKDEEDFQPSSIVWTDDKHSSYLSSMEDQFVRNMFEREFCAVDVCGQAPEHTDSSEIDSAASHLRSLHDGATSGLGKLMAWRNEGSRPVALKRHVVGGVGSVVFRNPWIKRFRPSTNGRINLGTGRSRSQYGSSLILGDHESLHFPTSMIGEQTPKLVSDVQKGVHRWQERLQSHCLAVDNRSPRIKPRVMKAFRRDDRILAEGACKRLKVQQLREQQGDRTSTVSHNRGWTAGARKRLKVKQQREHQGAFTNSRDRTRKFDRLPLTSLHTCEEEVEQQSLESIGQ